MIATVTTIPTDKLAHLSCGSSGACHGAWCGVLLDRGIEVMLGAVVGGRQRLTIHINELIERVLVCLGAGRHTMSPHCPRISTVVLSLKKSLRNPQEILKFSSCFSCAHSVQWGVGWKSDEALGRISAIAG